MNGASFVEYLLSHKGVHCDIDNVIEKLRAIRSHGHSRLKVFSDFDHTLTCHKVNNTVCDTTHAVIETNHLLPSGYKEKAIELKDKYYPIEISHDISKDQRIVAMEQWWTESHDLLLSCGFNRRMLSSMVRESNLVLRQGYEELFNMLNDSRVPLVVFSAGIGDVIIEVLNQRSCYYPNMEIVSNRMKFNDDGDLIGFNESIIHTYNKGTVGLEHDIRAMLQERTNVILLGDSLGDPNMVCDDDSNTILRIGYLNHHSNNLLPRYKELYDIVLEVEMDQDHVNTLYIPHNIIEYVL